MEFFGEVAGKIERVALWYLRVLADIRKGTGCPKRNSVLPNFAFADWISPLLWAACLWKLFFCCCFLLRLSGIIIFQVMSMGKLSPTAFDFGYDFWTENGLLRGSELDPKIITKIWCCMAIFSHRHDLGELDPTETKINFQRSASWSSRRFRSANAQFGKTQFF